MWAFSAQLESLLGKVPAGFALVPVTPGTEVQRGRRIVEDPEGKRGARKAAPRPGDAREARNPRKCGCGPATRRR